MKLDFFMPVKVISGEGCVKAGGDLFLSLGKKCLIVTGKNSAKLCGALDDCTAVLREQGIAFAVFDGIGQNPLLSVCEEAGQAARAFGAEFLVGIGGGSPLDATKAIAFFACNNLHGEELYTNLPAKALPMVFIGTTAGTGSEVTPYSVLTVDSTGRKKSFAHAGGLTYARYAFADPKYTAALPRNFTVSTALDALCHALESYFCAKANCTSDLFAAKAVAMLFEGMQTLASTEATPAQREGLLYGSIFAGIAISITGTGLCHPLGYFLSEEYGVPHGQACALYLRDYLTQAKAHCPEKYSALFTGSLSGEAMSALIGGLLEVKLPQLTDAQLHDIAKRCAPTGNFLNSPGVFTEDKAYALLVKIFSGS